MSTDNPMDFQGGHNYGSENPLNRQQYDTLVDAERRGHDLLPQMDKAQNCGVNCQILREQLKQSLEQISRIKSQYFPHGPPAS